MKPTNSSADFNNPEEVRVTVESFNQLYNDPSLTPEQKAEVFKHRQQCSAWSWKRYC